MVEGFSSKAINTIHLSSTWIQIEIPKNKEVSRWMRQAEDEEEEEAGKSNINILVIKFE